MTESVFESIRRAVRERNLEHGPQRALVVDDEESVRTFVARVLQEGGYQTTLADDGPVAIEVASREQPFDVLVTDLMMPKMNGDELARNLRLAQPGLKVLYLTGFSDKLFRDKVTLWEDEAYLDKPCSVKGLLEAVALLTLGHLPTPVVPPKPLNQA